MKKSSALLMGVLIVSVIMVITVTAAANSMRTLLSGTNISDWEIAHQAAESGLENALLNLKKWPDGTARTESELKYGYRNCSDTGTDCTYSQPVTTPCSGTPCSIANEPTADSELYNRRDMDKIDCKTPAPWYLPLPSLGTWPACDNPPIVAAPATQLPSRPSSQYWNYKIWRNTGTSDPGTNYGLFAVNDVTGKKTGYSVQNPNSVTTPAYGGNSGNYSINKQGSYSFKLKMAVTTVQDNLFIPITPPNSVLIDYWVWTDNNSGICFGVNQLPLAYDGTTHTCTTTKLPKLGQRVDSWTNFNVASGYQIEDLTKAGPDNGTVISRYIHVFYKLTSDQNMVGGSMSVNNDLYVAKNGFFYDQSNYIIEAIGMYGRERVKLRAIFNPYASTNKFWRANFY